MAASVRDRHFRTGNRACRVRLRNIQVVLGLLQVFCRRDLFLNKQLIAVLGRLIELDLGSRRAVCVLKVGKGL